MVAIIVVATTGYILNGWSLTDAFYMSILTVYSVGYQEVKPVDTPALHAITISLIVFGCTGMILLTGVLVQVFTVVQIKQLLGLDSVTAEIERLKGHVIICGFGRIGVMLAKDLRDGGADIVILERDDLRFAQAQAAGYLALHADAADEASLKLAGIERARVLAFVAAMMVASVLGYVAAGWSVGDAIYMVVLTLFSVGYGEVRPVDTVYLRVLTTTVIIFGCTAMILLTGVLVQVFTVGQIRELPGMDNVTSEVDRLKGHAIICGFGRIGVMLAKDLKDGEDVFKESRSWLFKKLQVVRFYDKPNNTLVYLSYSDKLVDGSPKNSISTVPIMPWGEAAAPKCADFISD